MSSAEDPQPESEALRLELIAYTEKSAPRVPVVPAPRWRTWIDSMPARWANRCLPLIVANEAGWVLLNTHGFDVVWDGSDVVAGLSIEFDEELPSPKPALSIFGSGVLTFPVPFLFRTPSGYNLLARGPANWPKDGICALEGLVETDWSVATFTMNWKLTRPNHAVRFEAEEPFCMIVPQRRSELESFRPVIRELESDRPTQAATKAWGEARHQSLVRKFLSEYSREYESEKLAWERHYFQGTAPDGTQAPEHQTRMKLSPFEWEDKG